MDAASNGEEGLPASTNEGESDCKCWSPKRSEEICMCHYAGGNAIHDINTDYMKDKKRSPGLHHQTTLSRRVLIQQMKELLNRADLMLQNNIRLQVLSQRLLQKSLRMQDLCVIAEDSDNMTEEIEGMSEGKECKPRQHDSMTEHYNAIVQDNGSMTEETSLGSRSG